MGRNRIVAAVDRIRNALQSIMALVDVVESYPEASQELQEAAKDAREALTRVVENLWKIKFLASPKVVVGDRTPGRELWEVYMRASFPQMFPEARESSTMEGLWENLSDYQRKAWEEVGRKALDVLVGVGD